LSILSLLAAKSMEAPVLESLTSESGVFPGQTGSNAVKPSQTQSNHFFTLTRNRQGRVGSIDSMGTAPPLCRMNGRWKEKGAQDRILHVLGKDASPRRPGVPAGRPYQKESFVARPRKR
jgi:hypothetical protein